MCRKLYFLISFVLVIALAVCNQSAADTLYYDDFDGPAGVDLDGTTPDTTTGGNVWVAGADFNSDGNIVWDGNDFGDSAYLPFTPVSGYIYTLSATIDVYSGPNVPDNNWVAVGFTPSNSSPESRFYNDNGSRNPVYWATTRTDSGTLNDQTFTGAGATGGADTDTISEDSIDIVLDTTLSTWVVQWYYNNNLKRTVNVSEALESNFQYIAVSTNRCDAFIDEITLTEQIGLRAADPSPADEAQGIVREVVLSWTPGQDADKHDVYLSTDFDDVNNATRAVPLGVLVKQNHDANTYDPTGLLEYNKTYYWRIDEVSAGGSPIYKGPVWSFKTMLQPGVVSIYHYYDDFDGSAGVDLNGSTPDITTDDEVWVAGSDFDRDGTVTWNNAGMGDSAYLPFVPENGYIYELSAILDSHPSPYRGTQGYNDWMALGFTQSNTNPESRFFDDNGTRTPVYWILSRTDMSNSNDQTFVGPETAGGAASTTISADSVKVVLDTTEDTWVVQWYYEGVPQRTVNVTEGNKTNFQYVAMSTARCDGDVEEFALIQYVPVQALNPSPEDDAMIFSTDVTLQWRPGDYADKHDVYLGTDFDDVNDDTDPNTLPGRGRQDPNYYDANGLTPGETYYWRIDEVSSGGSPIYKGYVWSFMIEPLTAYNPVPANGAKYITVDHDLAWQAGADADKHDVYFGEVFDDVNNATRSVPLGVLLQQNHDSNSYDPGTLELNKTYYWRIDEVNDTNIWKGDVWSFETMPIIPIEEPELLAYWTFDEGEGALALDWSGHDNHGSLIGPQWAEGYAEGAVRFDGIDDYVDLPIGDDISTLTSCTIVTWVNFGSVGYPQQRIFDFGVEPEGEDDPNIYMRLSANDGDIGQPMVFGITTGGPDGESQLTGPVLEPGWHHVAVAIDGDYEEMTLFLDGVEVDYAYPDTIPSDLGVTNNNWLGQSQWAADGHFIGLLDDFRIYDYAMTQEDLKTIITSKKAWLPDPPNNGTGVERFPVLSWEAGKYAAATAGHELYYSTEFNDVNGRVGDPIVLDDPCFAIPSPNAPYESLQVIYWAVDEINDSHPDVNWPGDVWTFTIKDYSVIDDFELYTDTGKSQPPPEGTLKSVWVDGNYGFVFIMQIPGTSGSLVQLNTDTHDCYSVFFPNCEHYVPGDNDIAQSGAQSMKFYYDNDGTIEWEVYLYGGYGEEYVYTPSPDTYLSEAYAAVDDAAQTDPELDSLDLLRDWSIYNVLGLSFHGDPNNDAEPMYVGLKDADGTLVTIEHPDPDLTEQSWHDWYIKLSDFTDKNAGLDLENIVRIYLGFGDKDSPASGGTGVVFFDDIQLFTGVCIPGSVTGDFDDTCVVDYADLEIFTYGFPGEMPTLPTPIINLSAASLGTGPLSSWSNSSGSGGGTFVDVNSLDSNEPVVEMVAGKKCVTFDTNDMLVWDQNAPATITSDTSEPNDFTVIYEVYNPQIADEEQLLTWAQRGGPAGTTAGFGYGSNAAYAAVVHWNAGDQLPDMGFDRGVPVAGQWHVIGVTYDGMTETLATDGAIQNLEDKDLAIYADQPVTIGAPFEVPSDPNAAYIRGTFVPTYGSYPFTGSVASIKVYGEAIPPGDLAILTASLAGLSNAETDVKPDNKIDFGDLAVLGNNWMQEPYLFGEDY